MKDFKDFIKEFQCPGCTSGCEPVGNYSFMGCENHSCGTFILGAGKIALGLPKGFCRPGIEAEKIYMRFYHTPEDIDPKNWNHFNIPVWAMEKDGYLFVRTYSPRINLCYIDIVKDGKIDIIPSEFNIFNVAPIYEDID